MSGWNDYVNSLTSNGVTHAGIFGPDGSKWAASPNFPVCLHNILNCFVKIFITFTVFDSFYYFQTIANLRDEFAKAFGSHAEGIMINGEKYIFICRQENFNIYRKGADAMVIFKLNQGEICIFI